MVTPTSSREPLRRRFMPLKGATHSLVGRLALLLLGILVVASFAMVQLAFAATFTVNSTGDAPDAAIDGTCETATPGECTLRAALEEANATADADTISFAIPGVGVQTITPASALPTISNPVVIDGYTQTGAAVNTSDPGFNAVIIIQLDGASLFADALTVAAPDSTIRGLSITGFAGNGITVEEAGDNAIITGNLIGLAPDGSAAGNADYGVYIQASGVAVGGSAIAQRNIISDNGLDGVFIFTDTTAMPAEVGTDNLVQNNYIGTNTDGDVDVGNIANGIEVFDSLGTQILGNLISGNGSNGIEVTTIASSEPSPNLSTVIQGNRIGTVITGTDVLSNTEDGINVNSGASGTLIGGTSAGAGNLISGNVDGIELTGFATLTTTIQGNIIGLNIDADARLGNSEEGIIVEDAQNVTIGGATAGAGNIISGNTEDGIEMAIPFDNFNDELPPNVIAGNLIGTTAAGDCAASGNNDDGLDIGMPLTIIGGTTPGSANLIGCNSENGIGINFSGGIGLDPETNIAVRGNLIGINGADEEIGNGDDGIQVTSDGNTIGGTTAASRNIISGNDDDGIQLDGFANTVNGNYIGTNAAGTAAVPNGSDGIEADGGPSNFIGGGASGRNIISGNADDGIDLFSDTNFIRGNFIGTDVGGTNPLPNGDNGIAIGGEGNIVGATAAANRNTIAFNGGTGIAITFGTRNLLRVNSIFSNTLLGIDLEDDGPTPNDPFDADGQGGGGGPICPPFCGPPPVANELQNFPVIESASTAGGNTMVQGQLSSTPDFNFVLDFYSSAAADPSSFGEGQTYLGSISVRTDSLGEATFTATFGAVAAGQTVIAATATPIGNPVTTETLPPPFPPFPVTINPNNNTSEFSPAVPITRPGNFRFSAATYAVTEGLTATITVLREGGTDGSVTVPYTITNGTATAGSDFTGTNGTLTFAAGVISQTFTITTTDDNLDEPNETVNLALGVPSGGAALGVPATAVLTIIDADGQPTLSINDVQIAEGNNGARQAVFTVTLQPASSQVVTLQFSTADGANPRQPRGPGNPAPLLQADPGEASSGSDYQARSGTLTFQPGETTKSVTVLINGDTEFEPDENFAVILFDAVGATIGDERGIGTILADGDVPQATTTPTASATATATSSPTTLPTSSATTTSTATAAGATTSPTTSPTATTGGATTSPTTSPTATTGSATTSPTATTGGTTTSPTATTGGATTSPTITATIGSATTSPTATTSRATTSPTTSPTSPFVTTTASITTSATTSPTASPTSLPAQSRYFLPFVVR